MKINITKTEKIDHVLKEVQKGCSRRTIDANDIVDHATKISARLEALRVPKKAWEGARFVCNPHKQHFANAYKFAPRGTEFVIQRFASGWFLTACQRWYCNGSDSSAIQFSNENDYQQYYKF